MAKDASQRTVSPTTAAHRPSVAPAVRRPRLGFLGVGWIGQNRLQAIAASDEADIIALCDATTELAERAAARLPRRAMVTANFDELLTLDLDGVVIATPSALHAGQAITALSRGIPVFCQKPLARTADETKAVVVAARKADRLLAVDLSYRWTQGMQCIRELITNGTLGEVYAASLEFHNAYGPDKPWFYDRQLSGGGCLIDLGIHLVDLALWCFDFPAVERVAGRCFAAGRAWRSDSVAIEDYASAQLHLASGAVAQLACSWRAPAGCDAVISAKWFGTRGGAVLRNVNGSFFDFVAEHLRPDRTREVLCAPPDDWGGRAALAWVRRLACSPHFDPEAEQLNTVAAAIDAIYADASRD